MSIEQKIAEILAESKANAAEDILDDESVAAEEAEVVAEETQEEAEVVAEETAEETKEEYTVDVKEDVAALVNGEELSEEFKTKAATIFEAAIVTRVKQEVARLEEEFNARLEEAAAKNQEGLVEKVDGYLNYVVEQWIKQNEIALEAGIRTEMMESFVAGLKGLFEEHNIDIPEEKVDLISALENDVVELQAKLDEQVAANVELTQSINEAVRESIIAEASEGLAETDKEKFAALAEELTYEDAETFTSKVQTIRENYFTATSTKIETVVTDEPIVEEAEVNKPKLDPRMAGYVSALKKTN
jgi:hypothetical protein